MISDLRFLISDLSEALVIPRRSCTLSISNPQSAISNRLGISLIEVLISMFVMLFGLMGVAAIFPVGNYYVVEGEKHDLGSLLAANAFEELQTRGMLRPERWLYADVPTNSNRIINNDLVIQNSGASVGLYNYPSGAGNVGAGRAFVIDAQAASQNSSQDDVFPYFDLTNNTVNTAMPDPWKTVNGGPFPEDRWPVRRITLPQAGGLPLNSQVAETIFRLRDDLAVEMPERDDAPSIQRWNVGGTGNLLSRQYQGNFSWLATIVPSTEEALLGLQPAERKSYLYEVSVVVFYKRVPTPSAETERLLRAEMLPGGELVMYGDSIDEVDKGLEGIKSGAWVAVMGVNQTTGAFMLKWYRLLALDEETHRENLPSGVRDVPVRYAMLFGPDWHFLPSTNFVENLRVAILPGVASVVTREMVLERDSMWNSE